MNEAAILQFNQRLRCCDLCHQPSRQIFPGPDRLRLCHQCYEVFLENREEKTYLGIICYFIAAGFFWIGLLFAGIWGYEFIHQAFQGTH